MMVELYGGPGDGLRVGHADLSFGIVFHHRFGACREFREIAAYRRADDGVPFEQLAAQDGTARFMYQNGIHT